MSPLIFGIILVVVMVLIGVASALTLAIIVLAIRMRRTKKAQRSAWKSPPRPSSEEPTIVGPPDTPTVIRRTTITPHPDDESEAPTPKGPPPRR